MPTDDDLLERYRLDPISAARLDLAQRRRLAELLLQKRAAELSREYGLDVRVTVLDCQDARPPRS